MGWKQILNESDGSFIAVYEQRNQHQTDSFFKSSELPPLARHEGIADPPSPEHEWDGSKWSIDILRAKAEAKAAIMETAREKDGDFFSTINTADIKAAIAPFKTPLQNATTRNQINTARNGAISAIEDL